MRKYLICLICLAVLLNVCLLGCDSEKEQKPAQMQPPVLQIEDIGKITTPYAEFVLPEQWEQQLRGEVIEDGDIYTICFYGRVPGREEQRLFDLIFGKSSAFQLGTITAGGVDIGVYVESYDLVTDADWTDEERNSIYAMQDLINTILEQLYAMENFTPSP